MKMCSYEKGFRVALVVVCTTPPVIFQVLALSFYEEMRHAWDLRVQSKTLDSTRATPVDSL